MLSLLSFFLFLGKGGEGNVEKPRLPIVSGGVFLHQSASRRRAFRDRAGLRFSFRRFVASVNDLCIRSAISCLPRPVEHLLAGEKADFAVGSAAPLVVRAHFLEAGLSVRHAVGKGVRRGGFP